MKYFRFLFLVCSLVGQAQNFKTYEQACADGKTRPYRSEEHTSELQVT